MTLWGTRFIEVPILLAYFGKMLSYSVDPNFIIYRTCTAQDYEETECSNLGSNHQDNITKNLDERVQPIANIMTMTMVISGHILPAFACIFLGHWSDRNGRKPILLSTMIGQLCTTLIKIMVSSIPSLSPWFLVLQVIPVMLSGGAATFAMICFCYLAETTSEENRNLRMGIFEVVCGVATIVGVGSSSFVFDAVGYTALYTIAATFEVAAIILIFLFIKESAVITDRVKLFKIFTWKHIQVIIDATVKIRRTHIRTILLLLMITLALHVGTFTIEPLLFQYLRVQFGWDLRKFTLTLTWYSLIHAAAIGMGLYVLQRLLGVSDGVMLIAGFCGSMTSVIVIINAKTDWYIYLAAVIKSVSSVIIPIIRSMITKIVDFDEVGKIFAVLTIMESFSSIGSFALHTVIYNKTLITYPAAFLFVELFVHLVGLTIIIVVLILKRKQGKEDGVRMLVEEFEVDIVVFKKE